jgi:Brp/Blh family beta-carotene 15,15'-monooxygenase
MTKEENWLSLHRRLATIATALALVPLLFLCKDVTGQALFFILNVLLFGVCHGALDHLQCPPDKNGSVSGFRLIAFGGIYLALAGLILYVWLHDPGPMLVSFLSVSCLHFALDEDRNLAFAHRLVCGFLPVLAPCFLHVHAVSQLFSFLIGSQTPFSSELVSSLRILGFIICGLATAFWLVDVIASIEKRSLNAFIDSLPEVLILMSCIILPPLLSFTIYFCWWHSLRQCIKLVARFKTETFLTGLFRFLKAAAPLTVGSWLLAATIYLVVPRDSIGQNFQEEIRTIFYLLSALTVPHMLLALVRARDEQLIFAN